MQTKTITISVKRDVEERFRKLAGATYGKHKGYLGKAVTDAMTTWVERKGESDVVAKSLKLLETGIKMGKFKFKSRDELHER